MGSPRRSARQWTHYRHNRFLWKENFGLRPLFCRVQKTGPPGGQLAGHDARREQGAMYTANTLPIINYRHRRTFDQHEGGGRKLQNCMNFSLFLTLSNFFASFTLFSNLEEGGGGRTHTRPPPCTPVPTYVALGEETDGRKIV